ncbi:hypothetical protein Hanom_Chr11g01023061 [Helianthus anomalus]
MFKGHPFVFKRLSPSSSLSDPASPSSSLSDPASLIYTWILFGL